MQLSADIKKYIQDITKNSYSDYTLQLEKICKDLSLKCFVADFDDDRVSGAIVKDESTESYSIYANRKHSANRQRFTIAHEIGHYISFVNNSFSKEGFIKNKGFEDYTFMLREEGVSSEAETEANQIAAEMLMPEDKIKELINDKCSLEKMAELFYVSIPAMSIRLQNLYGNASLL